MSKIGVVTFHNGRNYGAALQTFALQEALRFNFEEVNIINYDNRFISKGLDRIRFDFSVRGFYYAISDLIHINNNKKIIKKFQNFFSNYYILSELVNKEQLKNGELIFDIGISGSDQIWNPILNDGVDDIYFLNIPGIERKFSYASSIGSYKFDNEDYNNQIRKLLASYTKVSVRENSEIISEIVGMPVKSVCDPTLLLSKEDWSYKLGLVKTEERYLLIYAMTDFKNITNYAVKIANKLKLSIKYIGMPVNKNKEVKYITDAGPKEFVDLFYNATYIVTNSFHGTAFALNFAKQFVSLQNPKNPERAMYFLESINAKKRLVSDYSYFPCDITDEEMVLYQKNLKGIVLESIKYLKSIGEQYE